MKHSYGFGFFHVHKM